MSCAGSAIGLAPLRYWGSPVELLFDCNLSRFTRHRFLAILLDSARSTIGTILAPLLTGALSTQQREVTRAGLADSIDSAIKQATAGMP